MAALIPNALRIYRFHPENLDPIAVYIEEFSPTSSRMTVQCYAQAWTAYWGAHGERGVENFVITCSAEYVADNLTWGNNGLFTKAMEKRQATYLRRIVQAIQSEFRAQQEPAQ